MRIRHRNGFKAGSNREITSPIVRANSAFDIAVMIYALAFRCIKLHGVDDT